MSLNPLESQRVRLPQRLGGLDADAAEESLAVLADDPAGRPGEIDRPEGESRHLRQCGDGC